MEFRTYAFTHIHIHTHTHTDASDICSGNVKNLLFFRAADLDRIRNIARSERLKDLPSFVWKIRKNKLIPIEWTARFVWTLFIFLFALKKKTIVIIIIIKLCHYLFLKLEINFVRGFHPSREPEHFLAEKSPHKHSRLL